ncbi:MAG: c-type cytochrome [Ignavibacteriota bacterium]
MKSHLVSVIGPASILIAGLLLALPSGAQSPATELQRGAEIVAHGTGYGVVACARCHAFDGSADGSGAFPKLSGIPAYYLAKELRDFASGSRYDAIMSAIARKMKPQDIDDVAAYYANSHGAATVPPAAKQEVLDLGIRLATVGDEEKKIQACEGCHGAQGRGEAPAIPPLAGQYAPYIAFQMRMWQKGYRKNDASQQMANLAGKLSPQDVEALGLYFERLTPSGSANKGAQR